MEANLGKFFQRQENDRRTERVTPIDDECGDGVDRHRIDEEKVVDFDLDGN